MGRIRVMVTKAEALVCPHRVRKKPSNARQSIVSQTFSSNFSETISAIQKMYKGENMYFEELYKIYLEHFAKFCILAEINDKNHDIHRVSMVFTMKIG